MLMASTIHPPRVTIHEPQPVVTNETAAGELPALLQQSLAMWDFIFAHQTGAPMYAAPPAVTPPSPVDTTGQSSGGL